MVGTTSANSEKNPC